MDELERLRGQIDELDGELLRLFEARMAVVQEIGAYKAAHKVKILDESREQNVLAKTGLLSTPQFQKHGASFLRSLMAISKALQEENSSLKEQLEENRIGPQDNSFPDSPFVGYQGLPGSYSEQALREYFGEGHPSKNYQGFEDIFQALHTKEIDYGVLPLENSFAGAVAEVYSLLCRYGFYIVGEKCIRIDHNLLAVPGASIEDIREVYSHPQAFLQSSRYLQAYPQWGQVACSNTAVSARMVAEGSSFSKGAIASKRAAQLYGLNILAEGINNTVTNYTRFIIIGRNPEFSPEKNKLSMALAIAHEPGSLARILQAFALKGLNMLKIESRPMENKTWEYLFYIDLEGNLRQKEVGEAIEQIKRDSTFFRLLGNYRLDK